MAKQKKFGICQSRGLGDIVIALPIARAYHNEGYLVHWPICEEFLPSVKDHAPWVKWIPIPTDSAGEYFYNEPMTRLKNFGCDEIICLYQSLNVVPELSDQPFFQIQHFDEFKYSKAGVPFLDKWCLDECIIRDAVREQALYDRVVTQSEYYVTHFEGSDFTASPDLSSIPAEWQRIDIKTGIADSVFDWLSVIEGAQALIAVDSVISNMVDQLKLEVDKYWIPRSHIHLTPVLGMSWTILDPPPGSKAVQKIFAAG
jgi:hypothetical protein